MEEKSKREPWLNNEAGIREGSGEGVGEGCEEENGEHDPKLMGLAEAAEQPCQQS